MTSLLKKWTVEELKNMPREPIPSLQSYMMDALTASDSEDDEPEVSINGAAMDDIDAARYEDEDADAEAGVPVTDVADDDSSDDESTDVIVRPVRRLPQLVDPSEANAIEQHMNKRRTEAEKQAKFDAVKGEICQRLLAKVDPAVKAAVSDLFDTNRDLYNYVRKLESLNQNIWCDKCRAPATVHDSELSAMADEIAGEQESTARREALETAKTTAELLQQRVQQMNEKYNSELSALQTQIMALKGKLAELAQ